MKLIETHKASDWPRAHEVAATLRRRWKRPAYMVRMTGRYTGTNTWDREWVIRVYRR